MNLIALRAFGSIGLYSFVAIRRRQRGQITTGCFGRGPMLEKLNTIKRTCQSGEIGHYPQLGQRDFQIRTEALGIRTVPRRALQSPGFWRIVVAAENVLAVQRSLRPCACKDIGLPLFFGFGLESPTYRFVGILPELINL